MKASISHLLVVALVVASELAGGQDLDISQGWRFRTGDNAEWSSPALDDSKWQEIAVAKPWEEQGHPNHDGFAWYRKHIRIPSKLRDQADFRSSESLLLSLGTIDDVDETWFNGQRIGGTGTFPPDYQAAWQARRSYAVPGTLVHWDTDNVIAVRVYDGEASGGLLGQRYRLGTASLRDVVRFEWDLQGGDGLFHGDEPIEFRASLHNDSRREVGGTLQWTLKDDEGEVLVTKKEQINLAKKSTTPINYEMKPPSPGFFQVVCVLNAADNVHLEFSKFVGYQPEEIQAPLTRVSDFDEFWDETLKTLANVKPEFKMQRRGALDSATHEVYEVSMRSLDNVLVRGWYEKPKAKGSFPALLRVPGYGQNMRPTGSESPIALFSFNVRGHGNSQDDIPGRPQDYWIRGLDDKVGYYYQGAYADCVRAVDFLNSRPEVDKRCIGVTGGSQGGGLSLATAALDRRISVCAPDIPFLCDWVRYFKASHWPEMDKWVEEKPERNWKLTLRTMSYFDTLNMADRIRCPVFMSLGVQDGVCPPSTVFSVYNRLAGRKEYRAYPNAGHWVPAAHRSLRSEWISREFAKIRGNTGQ